WLSTVLRLSRRRAFHRFGPFFALPWVWTSRSPVVLHFVTVSVRLSATMTSAPNCLLRGKGDSPTFRICSGSGFTSESCGALALVICRDYWPCTFSSASQTY